MAQTVTSLTVANGNDVTIQTSVNGNSVYIDPRPPAGTLFYFE